MVQTRPQYEFVYRYELSTSSGGTGATWSRPGHNTSLSTGMNCLPAQEGQALHGPDQGTVRVCLQVWTVYQLRRDRRYMVQTRAQYEFVYRYELSASSGGTGGTWSRPGHSTSLSTGMNYLPAQEGQALHGPD
jgi:hypothetical protein